MKTVIIKQPGPALQYRMQVNNMFTEIVMFCPSKANTQRVKAYLAIEMSLNNA